MSLIVGSGITVGSGVSIVSSNAVPVGRATGSPSTNPSQTWTSTGIKTSSYPSAWGGGSGNFTTATRIAATGATWANVGSGDFTFEFWMYVPTATSNSTSVEFFQLESNGGIGLRFGPAYNGGNYNYISIYARNQADLDRAPIIWPRNQWNYVVVQRSSTIVNFWVNGSRLNRENGPSGTCATRTFANAGASPIYIGESGAGGSPSGCYFNDFCISSGYARYTANSPMISVPTGPLTVDQYTTQLLPMTGANGASTFTNATGVVSGGGGGAQSA